MNDSKKKKKIAPILPQKNFWIQHRAQHGKVCDVIIINAYECSRFRARGCHSVAINLSPTANAVSVYRERARTCVHAATEDLTRRMRRAIYAAFAYLPCYYIVIRGTTDDDYDCSSCTLHHGGTDEFFGFRARAYYYYFE